MSELSKVVLDEEQGVVAYGVQHVDWFVITNIENESKVLGFDSLYDDLRLDSTLIVPIRVHREEDGLFYVSNYRTGKSRDQVEYENLSATITELTVEWLHKEAVAYADKVMMEQPRDITEEEIQTYLAGKLHANVEALEGMLSVTEPQ